MINAGVIALGLLQFASLGCAHDAAGPGQGQELANCSTKHQSVVAASQPHGPQLLPGELLRASVSHPDDDQAWFSRAGMQTSDTTNRSATASTTREQTIRQLQSLPLPSQTVEGYGGGAITPVAYLVNPGPPGTLIGRPAVSFANVIAGKKNVQAFIVTQTLLRRIELGYALDRVDLGTLPEDVKDTTGVDIQTHHVWLHNFNARAMLLDETAFEAPYWPSLTAGTHLKINDGIDDINDRLRDGLGRLGYHQACGVSFTLTMSKTLVHRLTLNRPLFLTVGMRSSPDAQLGVLGFSDHYETTVEAGVGYLLTKNLLVNYEFRQKNSPYHQFPGLIGQEDNWHAVGVSFMFNEHLMLNGGWAALGTLANTVEDGAWYLQLKYDF